MKSKNKKSTPTGFICTLIAGVVLLTGCYLKQKPVAHVPISRSTIGPSNIQPEQLDRFFSDMKKIDGQSKAHYDMAVYFQKVRKHHLALQEFTKALQFDPTDARTYTAMGISYDKTGESEKAVDCYEMAIKLDPRMASAYNNMGYSKSLTGDVEGALAAYKKAIELDDTNTRYRNNLDRLYALNGSFFHDVENSESQYELESAENKAHDSVREFNKPMISWKLGTKSDFSSEKNRQRDNNIPKKLMSDTEEIKDPEPEPTEIKVVEIIYEKNERPTIIKLTEETSPAVAAKESRRPESDDASLESFEIIYKEDRINPLNESREAVDSKLAFKTDKKKSDAFKTEEPQKDVSAEKHPPLLSIGMVTETNNIRDFLQDIGTPDTAEEAPSKKTNTSTTENMDSSFQPKLVEVIFKEQIEKPAIKAASNRLARKSGLSETSRPDRIAHYEKKMTGVSPAIETKILSWLLEDDKLDPKYVDNDTYIEVANGNGIRGEARRLAAHLASRGFKISRITNALSFDHLTTKILFSRANLDVVHQLFDGLAYKIDEQDLVEQKRMGDLIRIVVGKDMALVETPSDSLNTALALAKN